MTKKITNQIESNRIKPSLIGCVIEYPILNTLVNLLEQEGDKNKVKYCVTCTQEFRIFLSNTNKLDNKDRAYVTKLIYDDFIQNRIEASALKGKLKSYYINFLTALYKNNVKCFISNIHNNYNNNDGGGGDDLHDKVHYC